MSEIVEIAQLGLEIRFQKSCRLQIQLVHKRVLVTIKLQGPKSPEPLTW